MEREPSDAIFLLRKLVNPYCQNRLLGIILIKIRRTKRRTLKTAQTVVMQICLFRISSLSPRQHIYCICECKVLLK